ncbi:hypothetical protein HFO39_14140 [Rhizobium leguminosarum]|uniref:hypothetical protein n=1 Tax=Rhizobium leguminosarum TaxID=384 RepID=UPI001C96FA09|nr:hypothetical protein [Rhizobium leguminosarum]MBY5635909.1 hypothetical protein [Rhizobium leguminosarum]
MSYLEVTKFEQASVLTSASRIYTILDDPELQTFKEKMLDQIMFRAGETPLSLRADLDETQRKRSGDLLAQYLMERVNRQDLEALCDGQLRLQDLAITAQVERLIERCSKGEITSEAFAMPPERLLAMANE